MKRIQALMCFVAIGVSVLLAGCTGSEAEPKAAQPQLVEYAGGNALKCGQGLTPMDLGVVTSHTETNASYTATEEKSEAYPYNGIRQSAVILKVMPPNGVTIPAAIVHIQSNPDKQFSLQVGDGGKLEAKLLTAGYTPYPEVRPIVGVTLCLHYPS
jgi:hypothetical protein